MVVNDGYTIVMKIVVKNIIIFNGKSLDILGNDREMSKDIGI